MVMGSDEIFLISLEQGTEHPGLGSQSTHDGVQAMDVWHGGITVILHRGWRTRSLFAVNCGGGDC